MSATDEGRTERATEKQRKKFRDEGSVARSPELNSLFSFGAGLLVLTYLGGGVVISLAEIMGHTFAEVWKYGVPNHLEAVSWHYTTWYFWLVLPLFVILFVAVFAGLVIQVGFKISWKAVQPKWSKVNFFANFRKVLLSKQSIAELTKSLIKIAVLTFLAYLATLPLLDEYTSMHMLTPVQIGLRTWEFAKAVWIMIVLFMILLGAADFAWQKYQLEDRMKMRRQDVEDEHKQSMGDPRLKREQRLRGMQMLQNILSQNTKDADVVITNPSHFAVALKYKHGKMSAPKVVAKGVDHMAFRIRSIARKAGIPIVENRGLARALYHSTKVDSEIPENLFKPVAEILAFIFKLSKERAAHG